MSGLNRIRLLAPLPLLAALIGAVDSFAANAAEASPCSPQVYRWQDDCTLLATAPAQSFPLNLRYLPLADDGSLWMTLGAEYRLKTDSITAPAFGITQIGGFTATGQRFLLDADLRSLAGPRLFVQLSDATDAGRQPLERSFDKSAPDLAQVFVDLPLKAGNVQTLMRIGRQELDFDGNRLVAVRDVSNLRRAFDGGVLQLRSPSWFVEGFATHPTLNKDGAFDDAVTPGERFWGERLRWSMNREGSIELFSLNRTRPKAIYQDAVGGEIRRTNGLRMTWREGELDMTAQASAQRGTSASHEIRAEGVAADLGYSMTSAWRPRFGVSMGAASGDRVAHDGKLGTFDPIYPNLSYFTDAPLAYPGNDWDVEPNLSFKPYRTLDAQVGTDVLYRMETHDSVYQPPGVPLIRGTGDGSHFIAALSFAKASWHITSHVIAVASYVHASTAGLVQGQQGKDVDYGTFQLTLLL